jgi:hypothetical protein
VSERRDGPAADALRRELAAERDRLVGALDDLRRSTHVTEGLRRQLPVAVGVAFASGFVLSGGIGAAFRLAFRRGRERRRPLAKLGPFAIVS